MPHVIPASAKPRLEMWGALTERDGKLYAFGEEVIFEDPQSLDDLIDLVYHEKLLADFRGLALPEGHTR